MIPQQKNTVITSIKQRINKINNRLLNEQLFIYESDTKYCAVALVNNTTNNITASFAFNTLSPRDCCLVSSMLKFISKTRARPPLLASAA